MRTAFFLRSSVRPIGQRRAALSSVSARSYALTSVALEMSTFVLAGVSRKASLSVSVFAAASRTRCVTACMGPFFFDLEVAMRFCKYSDIREREKRAHEVLVNSMRGFAKEVSTLRGGVARSEVDKLVISQVLVRLGTSYARPRVIIGWSTGWHRGTY